MVDFHPTMTKLMQWLSLILLSFAAWVSVVTDCIPLAVSGQSKQVIWLLPVYLLIVFACYSLAVIGYRVATFNDCTEASDELQRQVTEARKDLTSKGFKFTTPKH
jgi:dolichyl-phosphate mannosyltransferase polypeptide 3